MRPRILCDLVTAKCTSGCPLVDTFLRGGFPCRSITEVVGESAACKTQLSLQLLLSASKSVEKGGLAGSALYLYTEGDPPIKRLQELAGFQQCRGVDGKPVTSLDHIYIYRDIVCPEDLLRSLERARQLLEKPSGLPLRLIVIDSLAHIFRDIGDTDGTGAGVLRERTGLLFQVAALLKKYADQHNLAVVVINQVMDAFDNGTGASTLPSHTAGMRLLSSGREVIPALGLAWANCINTRIFLSRGPHLGGDEAGGPLRCMQVVMSPHLPQSYCYYRVTAKGFEGVAARAAAPAKATENLIKEVRRVESARV